MRIIIAGGREFDDYELLSLSLQMVLKKVNTFVPEITVICGMARGADLLGLRWAKEHGHDWVKYPADWDRFGKRAGHIRNIDMSTDGNLLVAFWDGVSTGTKDMINIAKKKMKVFVINY